MNGDMRIWRRRRAARQAAAAREACHHAALPSRPCATDNTLDWADAGLPFAVVRAATVRRGRAQAAMVEEPLNTSLWPDEEMPDDLVRLVVDGLRDQLGYG